MATTHWKGATIPESGDDLLSSWPNMLDTLGVLISAQNVAAARTILSRAEAEGATPSELHPAYIDIGGIVYRADGSKAASVWTLKPLQEIEGVENPVSATIAGTSITRGTGSQHALITSTLPTRPYDRAVLAFGMANLTVTGTVGLRMLIRNADGQTARFETNASAQSQAVFNLGRIPAGADPQVILALSFGGIGNSTATVSRDRAATKLAVLAFPVTMG